MEAIINFFNNREKALIVWFFIVILFFLFSKTFRPSILSLLKIIFSIKIVTPLLLMFIYISIIVFAVFTVHLWDISLLKDTIIWALGTACIMFFNYNKVNTEKKFFKKVLLDNVKLAVFLQFIINLYVFNFVVELILVPVLFFLAALLAFSDTKKEYKQVKNILQFLLAIYGVFLIVFAFVHVTSDFKDFATLYNLKDFLLAPILTVTFLPFIYLLALYATYEALFTRVDIFFRDQNKKLRRFTKRQILQTCHLNLKRLNTFSKEYTTQLMSAKNKAEIIRLMRQFKVSAKS